jgi:hypothetical protein
VAEQLPHHPEDEGLSPTAATAATGSGKEKVVAVKLVFVTFLFIS